VVKGRHSCSGRTKTLQFVFHGVSAPTLCSRRSSMKHHGNAAITARSGCHPPVCDWRSRTNHLPGLVSRNFGWHSPSACERRPRMQALAGCTVIRSSLRLCVQKSSALATTPSGKATWRNSAKLRIVNVKLTGIQLLACPYQTGSLVDRRGTRKASKNGYCPRRMSVSKVAAVAFGVAIKFAAQNCSSC